MVARTIYDRVFEMLTMLDEYNKEDVVNLKYLRERLAI